MEDYKQALVSLLKSNNIPVTPDLAKAFEPFLQDNENHRLVETIVSHTDMLIANWKKDQRLKKVMEHPLRIPNGTVGKKYDAAFGNSHAVLENITAFEWKGLDSVGLQYETSSGTITGVPTKSGDIAILFCFRINGQDEQSPFYEKEVTLTINPEPKSLWKSIPSDRNDPYWKEDNVTAFASIGTRNILVSSKRGRSHANAGSFREDDFAFRTYDNGWSIVAVADGAGSAKASRMGSLLACQTIVEFFNSPSAISALDSLDGILKEHVTSGGEENERKINTFVYNNLGNGVLTTHKTLAEFAASANLSLKDLSTTLIFVLFKKYEYGYAILSFGVGDCPIGILNKDVTDVVCMNWLDVGEYGGGTRFITMPEIFKHQNFATRFRFKLINDFSYMVLMSDGIYDPKFVVESALQDVNKWREFLGDLGGNNEEQVKVELTRTNQNIEEQISRWMDFWSPGNHDDRTLAIVF